MKSKNIENSKFKNSGILFELLVRQVTADTLAGLNESPAFGIMKKYFNASTELGKELQLFRAFFDNPRPLTETKAIHFIDLVLEQRKKLDDHKLAKEKYNMIKEIKSAYPLREFLSSKVPNYVVHASIYKTFLTEINSSNIVSILNIQDVANAKFTLVEHLCGKVKKAETKTDSVMLEEFKQQSEDLRILAYQYIIDKFNSKYANLNDKQKSLLREYINNVAGTTTFSDYVRTEIPELKNALEHVAKVAKDKVMSIKLNEVAHQVNKIGKGKTVKDTEVTALMVAYELIKEMES